MTTASRVSGPSANAAIWKRRQQRLQARRFAAHQRDLAAESRASAAEVRALASRIRADAALVRDAGARTRDDAARVRDSAARVRDQAAVARDGATRTRDEAVRRRLLITEFNRESMNELLELDRQASAQAHEAAARDREAAELDRTAAEKDRDAAERDRTAASRDREAAEKDHEASEKDRFASEADRAAAESDRTESEEELEVAENLLTRSDQLATMGRLASSVAHELSNPLAALLSTLSVIERELDGVTKVLPLLDDARLAADRMCAVVSEMKVWIRDGSDKPTMQPIDLKVVIDEAVRLTRTAVEPAAKLLLDLAPMPPVLGVATRLGQVLTNLLLNAARATTGGPDQNEIRITTRFASDKVNVLVSDTGAGIEPDVLPHIFDPFFSTHEGSGGMGLGLAMCERIVHDHGGALTVETQLGKGTTFHLELPAAKPASAPRTSPVFTRAKVLLIDDDVAFCRSLTRLLSARCDVSVASNGLVGLAELRKPITWDLILCDVMMPEMNGLTLYEELRRFSPKVAAQLVFISGGATTEPTRKFLASLPNVQLQKPFDAELLFRMLDERVLPS